MGRQVTERSGEARDHCYGSMAAVSIGDIYFHLTLIS